MTTINMHKKCGRLSTVRPLAITMICISEQTSSFLQTCSKIFVEPLSPPINWTLPTYLTLPGYSWDALLKCTNVSLELITDPDMYLFIEKGLRGGISMVSHRHAIANNRYMQNYNPEQPTSFLQYLDANNLYGWAMSQPMPTRNFDWVDYSEKILDTPPDSSTGYFLEVDLDYPASLHTEHNDYPLAPEKMGVTKDMMSPYQQKLVEDLELGAASFNCKKLIPNLMSKQRYVLHYRNLQLNRQLGMEIVKVHKVLAFHQTPGWLHTSLRTPNSGQPPRTTSRRIFSS